ncbi:MAG: CpaF family protein [Planctomycetaceae bacterium]
MIAQGSLQSKPAIGLLTTRIRQQILDAMDLGKAAALPQTDLRNQVSALAVHMCQKQDIPLDGEEESDLVQHIMDEIYGLGPLQGLMNDPSVTEIVVRGFNNVQVERDGQREDTDVSFTDNSHLIRFAQRTITRLGRRIDEASPIAEVQLEDGSVLHAVFPPLSVNGPTLTIRRYGQQHLPMEDMVRLGSLAPQMADFLVLAIQNRANIVFSGIAGSGKTTLLNSVSRFIPDSQRVVTIEQTAELKLQQSDVVALQTRSSNVEGKGGVTTTELLRSAVRVRPDRIVLGETRGEEVLDMLQAMNSGQHGSMCTTYANDSADALDRLELMACLSNSDMNTDAVRRYIAKSVDFVVHTTKLNTGERKITRISELRGLHDGDYAFEDVFVYRQNGTDDSFKSAGSFYATGYAPQSLKTAVGDLVTSQQYRELFVPRELTTGDEYTPFLNNS